MISITVPPLRERGDDVLFLARHFLHRFAVNSRRSIQLPASIEDKLLSYDWPGNVPELENCMEQAVAWCRGGELSLQDLPEKVRLQDTRAADLLGLDRRTLNRRLERHASVSRTRPDNSR